MKRITVLFVALLITLTALMPALSEDEIIVVTLGDSYTSGEGLEPFYGQDQPLDVKCDDQDYLARRSEKSWSGQLRIPGIEGVLGDHRGKYVKNADGTYTLTQDGNWFFVAASGAETKHLFSEKSVEVSRKEGKKSVKGTKYLYPQLEIFDALSADGRKADYVFLTLGGNDINFAGFVISAVLNGPTFNDSFSKYFGEESTLTMENRIAALWNHFYDEGGAREKIKDAYRAVAEAAGAQATIIVAGYPPILSERGTGLIGGDSAKLLSESVSDFNDELRQITEELRAEGIDIHFVSVEEAFRGHEAYSPDGEYINPIIFGSSPQELTRFTIVSAYSVHPNELGTQAYARCVQAKIDELAAGE